MLVVLLHPSAQMGVNYYLMFCQYSFLLVSLLTNHNDVTNNSTGKEK